MTINNYEVVHFHVFDPSNSLFKQSKNERACAYIISCNNKDNCDLYKVGQCTRAGSFIEQCPYGKNNRIDGYSRRASNFYSWIKNIKEQYKDVESLITPSKKMCKIGEYIYLPYSFINYESKLPFLGVSSFLSNGNRFLSIKDFNIGNIIEIVNHRPQAMMGGEIKDYQKEEVPKFIKHLSEKFPELYDKLSEVCERAKEILKEYSYIGRSAYLKTTNPNFAIKNKGKTDEWFWNGDNITCKYFNGLFNPIEKFESVVVTVKPNDLSVIKIIDNAQVNDNTVFVD